MKQRLLVMNGQRLVQSEQGGQWNTDKVEKAGTQKPGIYDLYLSTQADKNKAYSGVIVHADKENVFQQIGKAFVHHKTADFDKIPEYGTSVGISYASGRVVTAAPQAKLTRGIS